MLAPHRLRPHSAYDALAAIAFFVAVAGAGAYAAGRIGPNDIKDNAVRSRHIKNGQVHRRHLGPDAVDTGKVIDGSLLPQDFAPGQLPRGAFLLDKRMVRTQLAEFNTPNRDGTQLQFACDLGGVGHPGVSFLPTNTDIAVVGTYSIDGTFNTVHGNGLHAGSSGGSVDINVMVRNTHGGRWANYDIWATYDSSTDACSFRGVIQPAEVNP